MAEMVKLEARDSDGALLDSDGREFAWVDFENLGMEGLVDEMNHLLKKHGLKMILGDNGDYYGVRVEPMKGGK